MKRPATRVTTRGPEEPHVNSTCTVLVRRRKTGMSK